MNAVIQQHVGRSELRTARPWSAIARLAVETAAREPFLRRLLVETVLARETPEQIVAAVLTRRLGAGRLHDDAALHALIVESFGDDGTMLEAAEDDLGAVLVRDPACRSPLHALLNLKGFQALQAHRVAHRLWRRGRRDAAHWLSSRVAATLGVDIHPAVPIGRGVVIDHGTGVVIGETAVVEDGVAIFQHVTLGATGHARGERHPKVRRGALLGAGSMVLGNVEVGAMSRVGAGSVVVDDVPAHATVVGIPARPVRRRPSTPERAAA